MVASAPAVSGLYTVATVVALSTAVVLWQHRDKTAARPLVVAALAAAVWSGGLFVSTLRWPAAAVAGIRGMYLGVGIGVAAVFVFALQYTGREEYVTRELLAVLAIHPVLLAGFVVFNPGELFFTGLDPTLAVGVDQQWGPAFWIHSAYGYLLVLATSLLIIELLVRSTRALYRGQALMLATGVFAPLPLNAVFLVDIVAFDTTPLGFVVMCACFAVAIVKYRFVDLSPIARKQVVANVRDGMIVVDTDSRVIDLNPAARAMLRTERPVIGATVDEILTLSESKAAYKQLTETETASEQTVELGDVYYHIESTPMYDGRERHVGWLFVLQDVTEQVRRERELERQIEKLDTFADIVSHDLRSPINVANGYIEQTRLTGDLDNLDHVEAATERMETIIDDVLELAREGQEVTDLETVDVETVARQAWGYTETNGASLTVETNGSIRADPTRLTRLFENLFRNAVDHAAADPANLEITVGVDDGESANTTLYVADNGVGIPAADQQTVLESGYSTDETGTGLGLAIVTEIAEAHDWELSVTDSETGGARFEISSVSRSW